MSSSLVPRTVFEKPGCSTSREPGGVALAAAMSAAPPAHRQALRKNTGGVTAGSARRPNSRAAPQGRRPLPSRGEGVWAVRLAAVKTLSSRARRAGEPWRRCATTSRHKHGNRGSAERGPAHPHAGAHPAGPDQPAILKVPSPGSPPPPCSLWPTDAVCAWRLSTGEATFPLTPVTSCPGRPEGPTTVMTFTAGLSGPPAGPGAGHAIRQRRPRRPGASALLPIRRPRPPFRAAPRRALGLGEAPGARPSGPGTGGGSRSTRRLCVGLTVQRPVSESHRKSHLRAPEGEGPESP